MLTTTNRNFSLTLFTSSESVIALKKGGAILLSQSIRLPTLRSLIVHQSVTCFQNSLCIFYRYLCNGNRRKSYENDDGNDNDDDNNDADDVDDDNDDNDDEDDDDNNDDE